MSILIKTRYHWTLNLVIIVSLLASSILVAENTGTFQRTIESKVLEEQRRVRVHLPKSYDGSQKKYPVLYLLDSEWSFDLFLPIIESLIISKKVPDLIIVGVENINDETRLRDFTPTPVSKYEGSGGADEFKKFIQAELIPSIDESFRTSSVRLIYGHSLGGLMSAYLFLNLPSLFEGSIATSPSFTWDDEFMARTLPDLLLEHNYQNRYIYLATGSEDFPSYLKAMNKFIPLLEKLAPKGLHWRYKLYANENHETMPSCGFPDGLVLFFKKSN